ncbi:hypothetical protein [Enterocloster asparagiformis]|jgi:DNA-binding Lrp family transcriptional regulator|nr:hypothetical protein [Enterocloster asparagiformis]UWO74711.1 hypothetical protein NQ535_17885 [[Clostridium] asparagiforme DSM 15981]
MLSNIHMNIIIRALKIRQQNGENPEKAIKDYVQLSEKEISQILSEIGR